MFSFFWSKSWTSYIESTGTSEFNQFLILVLKQPWKHMTRHSMISQGWTNLMWPLPNKCSYLLARNATCSVSFGWHLQCITLTNFHWKKHAFHLVRRWLSPLCLWYLTKEICRFMFPWNELQFVHFLQSPKWTVSFFSVSSCFTTAAFMFLSMLIMFPRWIQCFPWFSTLTQSPTQMHKASELLDSFFFAPQEREMIWDDAISHKQLTSPCSHSSSPIM